MTSSLTYTSGSNATYIAQKLNKELEYGLVYKISFWLYVPSKFNENALKIDNHLGVYFSNKVPTYKLKKRKIRQYMIDGAQVTFPVKEYDNWVKVEASFKPLCNINYIILGVFEDENWPDYYAERSVKYFIDDVELYETEEIDSAEIVQFECYKEEESYAELLDDTYTVYFDSDSYIPIALDTLLLESFVKTIKKNKQTIRISGHTDDTGDENYELSERRANYIAEFLNQQFSLDPLFYELKSLSDTEPKDNSSTVIGRSKNRRVEIEVLDEYIDQKLYRDILTTAKEKPVTAIALVNKWLYISPKSKHILLLTDRRLDVLRAHPDWLRIRNRINGNYTEYKERELAFKLDSLLAEDQRFRSLQFSYRRLANYKEGEYDESQFIYGQDSEFKQHDRLNLNTVLSLIDNYGWPLISDVGTRAVSAPFFIITHSLDIKLIEKYLPILKSACEEGEAKWINYANFRDRFLKLKGLPQEYGTHYNIEGKNVEYYKYESLEAVNQNRSKIGLPQISGEIEFKIK